MTKVCVIALCAVLTLSTQTLAAECKAPKLAQHMDYDKARKIILRGGFMAPSKPAYGFGKDSPEVKENCQGNVDLCNKYPEVACDGQGHCLMEWKNAYGHRFTLNTYGDQNGMVVEQFGIDCDGRQGKR